MTIDTYTHNINMNLKLVLFSANSKFLKLHNLKLFIYGDSKQPQFFSLHLK
jgi:hypothetical protein